MKGIYKITQKSTGKIYIGQSINIFNRWNQHIQSIDNLSFHKAYRENPTDFTFEILVQNDDWTREDLDKAEKRYIIDTHADDPKYGFNGTSGNGEYKVFKPIKMLVVGGSINKYIHSEYLKNIENKNILIIGNFKFCDTLSLYNNITIISDDYDFTCEDAKVIKVSTGEELMGEINKLEKDQFDLIIANPPYNLGNKIVNQFVDLAKESIVLMPISCYKNKELYKHIRDLELVDPKTFKDADITNNLCVCKLIDWKDNTKELFDIISLTYDKNYISFYNKNHNIKDTFDYISVHSIKDKSKSPDIFKSFMLTMRTIQNGTHSVFGKAADINWNINNISKEIPWDTYVNAASCAFIVFKNKKCKDNLCKFWYYNPLMNDLIKGLNSASGKITIAIPHIDWLKDRDYEHCTLDDIMKWLEEDNKCN